ncbi:MAG: hypothetical protein ACRDRP_19610, partial [Pseudonocardiaceae bacterium]
MTGWPPWRRSQPDDLLRYVQTGVLPKLFPPEIPLPGRSGAPAEIRLRHLYEAFARSRVRYADEPFTSGPGEQDIRPPDQVFRRPGLANCLDLSLAFAAGCLDAGLHPMVVILNPARSGPAGHAIVVVWLRGDWAGPDGRRTSGERYPLSKVGWEAQPAWPGNGLRSRWDAPGEFVAVDVARAAQDWTAGLPHQAVTHAGFADTVEAGARMLTGEDWAWDLGVDVGVGYRPDRTEPMPDWPDLEPLEPPYHPPFPPGVEPGPLESVRARNQIVPFEPRNALDSLLDWCLAPDPPPAPGALAGRPLPRVAVLHGVGGAGKTRLAAQLAHQLAADERWYAGFLRRDLSRRRLASG